MLGLLISHSHPFLFSSEDIFLEAFLRLQRLDPGLVDPCLLLHLGQLPVAPVLLLPVPVRLLLHLLKDTVVYLWLAFDKFYYG